VNEKLEDFSLTLSQAIFEAISDPEDGLGRPFFSLSEFLTRDFKGFDSVIDYVLETTGLRRVYIPIGTTVRIFEPDERSPAWLSQADIITKLAPFLSTRSDSFVIRAYGDVRSQDETIISKAWIEARVQRVITPLEPKNTIADVAGNATGFGRTFEIISIKWLNESEI
jgi:hypothetical protein